MKKLKLAILLIPVFFLFSCSENENSKLIVGNWAGKEWLVDGSPSENDPLSTSFSFQENGMYNYNYKTVKESGKYKVENDMLFTTPEGKLEFSVKIHKLTKDSLVFDMNRGGTPELLTLVRK